MSSSSEIGYLYDELPVLLNPASAQMGGSWQGPKHKGKPTAWGPDQLRWFATVAESFTAPLIFDIGASTGSYCLLAKYHVGMRVYAFEPVLQSFVLLLDNIWYNGLQHRVRPIRQALSDYQGEGIMHVPVETSHMGETVLNGQPKRYDRWLDMRASVTTLDAFCASEKIDHIDLIKMDVEGHELKVLKGGARMIQACHPTMLLEYYELNTRQHGYEPEDIRILLESWGYTCEMFGDQDMIATWEVGR
jgi:FkbM family methyltransferase